MAWTYNVTCSSLCDVKYLQLVAKTVYLAADLALSRWDMASLDASVHLDLNVFVLDGRSFDKHRDSAIVLKAIDCGFLHHPAIVE